MKQAFTDIDSEALDTLVERVKEAKQHDLALSAQDCQLLLDALVTLASLQERLADNDITLHKLRKLVGIVKSSEKMSNLLGDRSQANQRKKKRNKPRGRSAAPKLKPVIKQHQLDGLSKGDPCPECKPGKLYKYEPACMLRITGQSPFVPEQHVMERLRCNACGQYFTADLPQEVLADGEPGQKYGYSARSLMAIQKFYAGTPYYRQGSVQDLLGVSLAASTIFDQTERVADCLLPVHRCLTHSAANAQHYYLDDTSNRILAQQPIVKKQRNSDKSRLRSGVYSSGLVATLTDGHKIILFETNIGHAGEFIDDILSRRDGQGPPPILMSDALPSNRPSLPLAVSHSLCNAHGRRQFVDIISHFPEEVEQVLAWYSEIWDQEDEVRAQGLSDEARLAYHKQHSLPLMAQIRAWGRQHLDAETVEANSGLGKAINYFDKHYQGLTAFCRVAGAQLDNNEAERILKLIVRNRKNAMFHQTQVGADIADVVTSMIATAAEAGINVFDYFNTLQRRQAEVKADPAKFLPWNYQENV